MSDRFYAAVDMGTTTMELSLLRADGSVAAKHGVMNPQQKYGPDVISRMTWLNRHPGSTELKDCVMEEMKDCITKMLSWQKASILMNLDRVVVTCNTVMAAILLGLPVEEMGRAPFPMPFSKTAQTTFYGVPMTVLAGVSAFLGSDSCGGAWALSMKEGEILMDLGTNGEMLLCHGDRLYGASAACGPAFENSTRSKGIYGATTISVVAEMIRRGKIVGDGTLPPEYAEEGIEERGIRITPKILQDIQLAVGALAATFSLLLKRAGLPRIEIRKIYLAGGFGFHLSLRDAGTIGLLPERLISQVAVAGNTSLLAAEKLASEKNGIPGYEEYIKKITALQFAGDPEYEERFYDSMILGPVE